MNLLVLCRLVYIDQFSFNSLAAAAAPRATATPPPPPDEPAPPPAPGATATPPPPPDEPAPPPAPGATATPPPPDEPAPPPTPRATVAPPPRDSTSAPGKARSPPPSVLGVRHVILLPPLLDLVLELPQLLLDLALLLSPALLLCGWGRGLGLGRGLGRGLGLLRSPLLRAENGSPIPLANPSQPCLENTHTTTHPPLRPALSLRQELFVQVELADVIPHPTPEVCEAVVARAMSASLACDASTAPVGRAPPAVVRATLDVVPLLRVVAWRGTISAVSLD